MKRTLAITATTAMLALSLAACGAERNGDVDLLPDMDGGYSDGVTATDTLHNDNGQTGTGMTGGATANTNTANTGLGSVTGAVNRTTQYDSARYGATSRGYNSGSAAYGVGGPNSSVYTATNNGGLTTTTGGMSYANEAAVKRAAAEGDRYARMLENGRVHDRDGFLLDGENTSYRTF